jgi:nucleolar complex protein 2
MQNGPGVDRVLRMLTDPKRSGKNLRLRRENFHRTKTHNTMGRGRTSKKTKKFEAKHLTRTIEDRKIRKKNKDKYNKNKVRNAERAAAAALGKEESSKKRTEKEKGTLLENMSVEEFLETGGGGLGDVLADEAPEVTIDEMAQSHKSGLEGLKEKDPSFYEFLKQNDKELLEFDPDELVEDEEEEEEPSVEGRLTLEILAKWEKLLKEQKSLSALKKLLIAVKNAAINVKGEEPEAGNTKYVLSEPEGLHLHILANMDSLR